MSLLILFCLSTFIIFLILFLGSQPTLIISTILLSLSFIANIPIKLFETKNDDINFNFVKGSKTFQYHSNDIYDSFTLQNYLKNENIKYKYLSNAINAYLTNFDSDTIFTKENLDSIDKSLIRYNDFWDEKLNLISHTKLKQQYTGTIINLNTDAQKALWKIGDKVELNYVLDSHFKSIDEIDQTLSEVNDETKKILIDFKNLTNDLINIFLDLNKEKSDYFGNFLYFTKDSTNNYALNKSNNTKITFSSKDLSEVFKYQMTGRLESNVSLILGNGDNLQNFIDDNLTFPTMLTASVLENYFINYTTIYYNVLNYNIIKDDNYNTYLANRKLINYVSYLNPFYAVWCTYTKYSGFYFDDFWFVPSSTSKIDFTTQNNLFLPYTSFNINVDNNSYILTDTYNQYFNPVYQFAVIIIICLILLLFSIKRFNKIDIS
ncbi:transmembrane protein [Spiroplasma turonicum]|uniref:Transmembrane protein n=2 Tax=Spiroplasma turonicum TaxID=216946 RepID=A0A0K1P707_9MOLU|nr:hypothetical protein [Spiroplasma turonicum]AKU80096.1 transmembrane protein [Spiroplasma turonicum]